MGGRRLIAMMAAVAAAAVPLHLRAQSDPWAAVRRPSPGTSQPIGSAAAGCLAGAAMLPPQGIGYQVLRLERNRFYGHPSTIAFVRRLAAAAAKRHLGVLLIGDMAQPRGGPMPSGHGSHQTGLDVDIWLELPKAPLSAAELARPQSISMVKGRRVDRTVWGSPQARLLELAARSPGVDRIFVNPAIKAELCHSAGKDRAWLAKLRPWWGHDEHFHVRMACPADDPACVPQRPVPEGDGCGWELYSWLVKPTLPIPADRPNHRHPVLPAACKAVLDGRAVAASR